MSTLHRAVIRAYTAGTHKADVQLAESVPTHLIAIPVATDIPAAEVQAGRECAVLLFDDNPDNGVVVTVHGAVPAGVAAGSYIADTDGNTYVRTEQVANEDKVRAGVAGTERLLLQTASPHLTITGDTKIGNDNSRHGIGGAAPDTISTLLVRLASGAVAGGCNGITIGGGGVPIVSGAAAVAVQGTPMIGIGAASTGSVVDALNLYTVLNGGGAGTVVAQQRGAVVLPAATQVFTGTITEGQGIAVQRPVFFSGTPVVTTAIGVDVYNIGHARVQTAYGVRVRALSTATVAMQPFRDEGSPVGDVNGNRFASNTQFASLTGAFGTGTGVIGIANAAVVPTTNAVGGGILYASAGALVWRGSAGTVTVIAPA